MGPFSVCDAATRSINNLLQQRKYATARLTAWVVIIECVVYSMGMSLFFYFGSYYIAVCYSSDSYIINRVVSIAPYGATFQLFYGLHMSCQAVLRALGKQKTISMAYFSLSMGSRQTYRYISCSYFSSILWIRRYVYREASSLVDAIGQQRWTRPSNLNNK